MKITNISREIKFDTQQWIYSLIEYNTQQRYIFKNNETKSFFLFMNPTVYWKTIEYLAKRTNIKI